MPTFVRYLLIQLPGALAVMAALAVARRWVEIPAGVFALVAAAWIAKDLALYPLLRHAYEVDPRSEMEKLAGGEVIVKRDLDPRGLVVMNGELWKAEAAAGEAVPIPAGARVRIEGHRGLVLLVRAAGGDEA
jgi:membrane protein implicated in regulation of membrane protease activity